MCIRDSYSAATNTWTTMAPLATARREPATALLPDGRVLVSGGEGIGYVKLASAEIYNPATNTWSPAGTLAAARSMHTATTLGNGKVLVVGGAADNGSVATAEPYSPCLLYTSRCV